MRSPCLLLAGLVVLTLGCAGNQSEEIARLEKENAALRALVGPPPSSLDNLFPPKANGPVLLFKMIGLATPLTAIVVDLSEKDLEQAKAHFARFRTQYAEVSKLVPEWESAFPLEPVAELGTALDSGDQDKVMAALGRVGRVCHNCHVANMAKVQQKYHWGDFDSITVSDPMTQDAVSFEQLMHFLETSLVGIGVDLEQGQRENALKHFEALNERFQSLKKSCTTCHGPAERKYFVDKSVQVLVSKLGAALKSTPPNAKLVRELSQGIGMESCFKCHLVHVPAALARARWQEWGEPHGGKAKEK